VGLWNHIRLPASDGPILAFTARSLRCYTSTVRTMAASPNLSPRALERQLESPTSGGVEFSTGSFWQMANSELVEGLANRTL
jgi:hypothetical protein